MSFFSSSWKMRVKKGVLEDSSAKIGDEGVVATAGVGKSAGKRREGLPDEKTCSDDDDDEDDEDDIPLPQQSTSCRPNSIHASEEIALRVSTM